MYLYTLFKWDSNSAYQTLFVFSKWHDNLTNQDNQWQNDVIQKTQINSLISDLRSKFKKVCSKENLLQENRIQLLIHSSKHSNILWKYSYKIVITSNDENEKIIDENVMTYELCYCNEIDMYWITLDNTFCWIKNCFELSFFIQQICWILPIMISMCIFLSNYMFLIEEEKTQGFQTEKKSVNIVHTLFIWTKLCTVHSVSICSKISD